MTSRVLSLSHQAAAAYKGKGRSQPTCRARGCRDRLWIPKPPPPGGGHAPRGAPSTRAARLLGRTHRPRLPGARCPRATLCQRPLCQPCSAPQGQAESGGMVLVAYAGPVRPAAALRASVLCLPTDIHSLFVNKPSSSSSSSSSMLEQACSPVSPGDATLTEEIHRLTRVTARGLHLPLKPLTSDAVRGPKGKGRLVLACGLRRLTSSTIEIARRAPWRGSGVATRRARRTTLPSFLA